MTNTLEQALTRMLQIPERLVDGVGMYRVVSLSLWMLVGLSLVASVTNFLAYTPGALLLSLAIALALALGLNVLFALVWRVTANHESAVITALIMFFMMIPSPSVVGNWQLAAGVTLAIASKYIIAYRRQHIVNPAAIGAVLLVVIIGIINLASSSNYNTDIFSWWVANPVLLFPVFLLGVLVVTKIRKWTPVLWFLGVGSLVFVLESVRLGFPVLPSLELYAVSFPTLFLAFFMLTEPFTMPPTKKVQAIYGGLVGVLSSTVLFAPWFAMTPELALVFGNLFAYVYRIRRKLFLPLLEKREIARDTWEFVFKKPEGFYFKSGQYLEWMLPHENSDSRGMRRYFTIASSPTEAVVRLAMKIMPENGSSYKAALKQLDEGGMVISSQLAGDFLLPSHTQTKLGFIAGGIGVTPFISHIRYMQASDNKYDTAMYYCSNTIAEIAYREEFETTDLPLEFIPVIAKEDVDEPYETGFVTTDMLNRRTPDWRERTWYLSGPPGMVNAYYKLLRDAGLSKKQIKKDFFPGLA